MSNIKRELARWREAVARGDAASDAGDDTVAEAADAEAWEITLRLRAVKAATLEELHLKAEWISLAHRTAFDDPDAFLEVWQAFRANLAELAGRPFLSTPHEIACTYGIDPLTEPTSEDQLRWSLCSTTNPRAVADGRS